MVRILSEPLPNSPPEPGPVDQIKGRLFAREETAGRAPRLLHRPEGLAGGEIPLKDAENRKIDQKPEVTDLPVFLTGLFILRRRHRRHSITTAPGQATGCAIYSLTASRNSV